MGLDLMPSPGFQAQTGCRVRYTSHVSSTFTLALGVYERHKCHWELEICPFLTPGQDE